MRLLIAVLSVLLVGCGPSPRTNELIGEWIGVNSWKGSGLIFDFKNDNELFIGAIGTDSATDLHYKYDKTNKALIFDYKGKQETIGHINKITADRFTLLTTDSNRLEFLRIKDIKPKIKKEDLIEQFKNSSWVLKQGSDSIRMDFLPTHRWDDNHQPFEAMFHYWLSNPYKEKEIWNIGEYNGKLFMFFTNHQTEQITQQVIEVNLNKIVLVSHTSENSNQAQVINRTKDKTQGSIDKLTARPWTSIHLDTTFCQEWGQINIRNKDVKELRLLLKQMEFRFNSDKSYSVFIDGREWIKGQWKRTSDEAYIILDDERDKKNWIEVRQENQNLVLTKLQQIKDGDRDYKLYLLTIRLE